LGKKKKKGASIQKILGTVPRGESKRTVEMGGGVWVKRKKKKGQK